MKTIKEYMFSRRNLMLFFCCEGRIIVNPGAKCKIIWEGSHPRMYFLRTHNFLPYSAVYLILKEKNYYLEKDYSQNCLL